MGWWALRGPVAWVGSRSRVTTGTEASLQLPSPVSATPVCIRRRPLPGKAWCNSTRQQAESIASRCWLMRKLGVTSAPDSALVRDRQPPPSSGSRPTTSYGHDNAQERRNRFDATPGPTAPQAQIAEGGRSLHPESRCAMIIRIDLKQAAECLQLTGLCRRRQARGTRL